ncbi:MAG TPA: hypothetical protein DIU47_01410 [Candidatus Pacebacteria bacterium]|nr:hypothetical protein [Candidatus Yonathbacteria bacterium]HCR92597.1 hypothetical protein [Candidatus Paceibacterota bacterium]
MSGEKVDSSKIIVIEEGIDFRQFTLPQLHDWLEAKRQEANTAVNHQPAQLYDLWQRVSAYVNTEESKKRHSDSRSA